MYFCTKFLEYQQDMNEKKYISVKEWAEEDQPREKLIAHGKKQLTNAELIAILLRTGVKGQSVVDLAKEVLSYADNSLTTLSRIDFKQLSTIKGMANAKCATLMAALELGWRMQGEINNGKELIINNSEDLFHYMSPKVADLDREEFWAVYLSNRNKVIARQRIAIGGQTETTADMRIIFRGAIECKAVKLMVIHNHPSGSLKPSNEDKSLTRQLSEAGKLLQIKLLDHLIIAITQNGKADYYSFNDNGLI